AFEPINLEPFALFSNDIEDVDDLPEGAKIGINNDPANQGRALKMLEEAKVITLKDGVDAVDAKISDADNNPQSVEFLEDHAAQLARTLDARQARASNGRTPL